MIELLLTVVILMVGIVTVAQLVPVSIKSNLKNRNDSLALVAAQSLLEQMVQQPMNVNGGRQGIQGYCNMPGGFGAPPSNSYWFCDAYQQQPAQGYPMAMGNNSTAVHAPTADGCPLDALGHIDWTQDDSKCGSSAGLYYQYETVPASPTDPSTNINIEYRWRVIEEHNSSGSVFRKVFIVSAKLQGLGNTSGGGAGQFSNVIANVEGMAGNCIMNGMGEC